jgi:hypothetical protein
MNFKTSGCVSKNNAARKAFGLIGCYATDGEEASAKLRREPEIFHVSLFLHAVLCHSPERNEKCTKYSVRIFDLFLAL